MENFTFYNPTKILFGEGQIANITNEIPKDAKVLITYGGGSIKKNGVYDQVINALKNHNVFEFSGIEPNPRYETLMKAVEIIKANNIDFLLAVGGGSVLDGTKFIAAAACYEGGDPWNIVAKAELVKKALPIGCVMTLPATGSEMNYFSVVTRFETKDKLAFADPSLFPTFSVLDPVTTYTLPLKQISNGVVDAFIHVMEQYLTSPQDAAIQDRMAEGILLTLIEEGPKALEAPENYAVRANIMWAATWALNTFLMAGVVTDWATHRIGHEITAVYGLDHGQTLAIILPSLMNVKRDKKGAKILQYAERVWGITEGDENTRIDLAIEKTRAFFESLNIKTHFSDYDLNNDVVDVLLDQLKRHDMTAIGEHADIDLNQSRAILEGAL